MATLYSRFGLNNPDRGVKVTLLGKSMSSFNGLILSEWQAAIPDHTSPNLLNVATSSGCVPPEAQKRTSGEVCPTLLIPSVNCQVCEVSRP